MLTIACTFSTRWRELVRGCSRASMMMVMLSMVPLILGCGTMKNHTASDQLLMSDALDRAVSQIDFQALSGKKVYLDTKYIQNTKDPAFIGNQKGLGFVNAEYTLSSLRQQMVACGCLIQDKLEEADYVVEARLGAVGIDNNELLFGIPASNAIGSASSVVPNAPLLPAIPEIAFAKRNISVGAAKVGVFAYHRETRQPVWQSGIAKATSSARDTWVLGAGPFQRGSIYEDTQLAGADFKSLPLPAIRAPEQSLDQTPLAYSYKEERLFIRPDEIEHRVAQEVRPASFQDDGKMKPLRHSEPLVSPTGTRWFDESSAKVGWQVPALRMQGD